MLPQNRWMTYFKYRWFVWIGLAIAVAALVYAMAGCESNEVKSTAPNAMASRTTVKEKLDDKGKPVERTTVKLEGNATGTGASATGDKVTQATDVQPASVNIGDDCTPGINVVGGGGKNQSSAISNPSLWKNPLLWVGVLFILAAIASVAANSYGVKVSPKVSGIVAAAGVGFIFAAVYPVLTAIIVGGVAVVLLAGYLYSSNFGVKANEALRAVVAGVSGSDPEVQEAVKAEIKKQVEPGDSVTIAKVKHKDGLK